MSEKVGLIDILLVLLYLLIIAYLGWLGWRRTKTTSDYLVAGRKTHPVIMALSYGATFISTSAIVGFGGVAGMFGMGLLWLTFLNIFVGIFLAFVLLGGPTRHMGHRLDAHTFPELLGRRYQSSFIQVFAGLVIFVFMPLYAAAVLIGGAHFIEVKFGMDYSVALLIFAVVVAAYVIMGGLKGVMYTDALQGVIMFAGMIILLVWSYSVVGGVVPAHERLAELGKAPNIFSKIGFTNWTSMPKFGWTGSGAEQAHSFDLWWIVVSTITLGVGIGVLAQPQLVVRFMTVKSKRELNRAVLVGGLFILIMTGVAFTVGTVSNVYFKDKDTVVGTIVGETAQANVVVKRERDIEKTVPCRLLHIDTNADGGADTHLIAEGLGGAAAVMPKVQITPLSNGLVSIRPNANSFQRALTSSDNRALNDPNKQWMCDSDLIIPNFISRAMPKWFGILFLLTLLAAAMSTLSSQFHALGTAIGRDVYEQCSGAELRGQRSMAITRVGIIVGIILAVIISYFVTGGYIIARATSIFFGLCASAFLPAFVGGLFFKRATKAGAIASMIIGFLVTAFWLVFIKDQEARALGICHALTGKHSLLLSSHNWAVVDPIVVALPISFIVMFLVSLITRRPGDQHLARCFRADGAKSQAVSTNA